MEMAMYEKYSALLASEINNEMPQTNLIVG